MNDNKRDAVRKISRFRETINRLADAECLELSNGIDELRDRELLQARDTAEREASEQLTKARLQIETSAARDVAERKREQRRELALRRETLKTELFDEVKARLSAFAKSPEHAAEYADWLNRAKAPFADMEITEVGGGGFTAVGNAVRADKTFETMLKEQESRFLEMFASAG
jgi:hypothetical protein